MSVEAAVADADRAVDAVEQDLRDDIGPGGAERRSVERRHRARHARGIVLMAGRAARHEDVGAAHVRLLGPFARPLPALGMADRARLRIVIPPPRPTPAATARAPINTPRTTPQARTRDQ